MSDVKQQVKTFLEKCEEVKSCKFIMATTKIRDLLKVIVNSSELYSLFRKVCENFNYTEAKRKYLITVSNSVINKSYVVLPEILGERLAFIFCLLADFDNDSLNFNSFLQCYYTEDGSYFSSYHAFCDQIIVSLQQIIAEVYKDEIVSGFVSEGSEILPIQEENTVKSTANPQLAQKIQEIILIISKEKEILLSSSISDLEKKAGIIMLDELVSSVKNRNMSQISALLSGYNYFSLYNNCVSENLAFLIQTLSIYRSFL